MFHQPIPTFLSSGPYLIRGTVLQQKHSFAFFIEITYLTNRQKFIVEDYAIFIDYHLIRDTDQREKHYIFIEVTYLRCDFPQTSHTSLLSKRIQKWCILKAVYHLEQGLEAKKKSFYILAWNNIFNEPILLKFRSFVHGWGQCNIYVIQS